MRRSLLILQGRPLACITTCVLQAAFGIGPLAQSPAPPQKRAVTVADAIEMTRLVDAQYNSGKSTNRAIAKFSPDNEKFVVVLRKGNLKDNTNEYSLVLWRTSEIFDRRDPEVLLTFSSSSNREAIDNVNWLDNETVSFLGEQPGQLQQVNTFSLSTHVLSTLTDSSSNILAYTIALGGKRLVFATGRSSEELVTQEVRKHGVRISSSDSLPDLIAGRRGPSDRPELFLVNEARHRIPIHSKDPVSAYLSGEPLLSPDGRYLLVRTQTMHLPEVWKEYSEPFLRHMMEEKLPVGEPARVERYEVIDTFSGDAQVLLDAPIGVYGSEAAWAPDSRSVVLAGVYLPLSGTEGEERNARQNGTFAVEVKIPGRQIVRVSADMKLIAWDARKNDLVFAGTRLSATSGPIVFYRKKGTSWELVADAAPEPVHPDIAVEEDLNTPPTIVAHESTEHRRVTLLDLNTQFKGLDFAKVEAITWKGTDGHEAQGRLYLPLDFVHGKKYPLVIQTHGFPSNRFWIDGPFTTAFAAQPLAGRGFVVLQANEDSSDADSPREVQREVSSLEGAIDHLDKLGLVDRKRVGVVGFSRTCIFVKFALTHSRYSFAAAVVADGTDAGYFQYVAFSNTGSWSTFEGINGGSPFGKGLHAWFDRSPGFNLDKVSTPVLIQAIGPGSILAEWEWFSGLTRLNEPVDMIYIPDGVHILEKPWNRMVSQQASVDWFCFWLKGEEDPDPAKAEQYKRWRELRKLQGQNERKSANAASVTSN